VKVDDFNSVHGVGNLLVREQGPLADTLLVTLTKSESSMRYTALAACVMKTRPLKFVLKRR